MNMQADLVMAYAGVGILVVLMYESHLRFDVLLTYLLPFLSFRN